MKTFTQLILAALILAAGPFGAVAQSLAVRADQMFRPALKELKPMFTEQTGFKVRFYFGTSGELAEQILSGKETDLFFPAGEESMQRVMEKGLVDVSLKRNILVVPAGEPAPEGEPADPQYAPAAVLLQVPHRLQAMAFLDFLTSEAARGVFAGQGFALP